MAKVSKAWSPGQYRPITKAEVKKWRKRLERAEAYAKQFHPQWKRALKRYAEAKVPAEKQDVDALLDYRHVEGKKAQLFHRTPEVNLAPIDPANPEVDPQVLELRQKVLNHELGPDAADAKQALHKTLVDTLAASGWMIVKVGYEDRKLVVPPDPMTGEQALGLDGKPLQVPVWSRRFIAPVSSMKLLVPDDFHDTRFDEAPWLAVKGVMAVSEARKVGWKLPDDYRGSTYRDEAVYEHATVADESSDPMVEYTEVWYRAALFDASVFHPGLYRCLIVAKDVDEACWHQDSQYQALTPMGGLTDDSMVGNPIHVGTLRDLVDSAYVPSDLVVGEQLSIEENKFRTDLITNRKGRRPITLISDAAGPDTANKILRDRVAVVPAAHIQPGGTTDLVAIFEAGSEPRDNFTAQDYIERDYEQALGMSANQSGQFTKQKRTATEVRTVQGNASARADVEQDRIRSFFVGLVRKFDPVVQRTMTAQELQKILGQQGAMLWEAWRQLPGRYHYHVLPDAGKYVDQQTYQQFVLQNYELLRKDDRVNTEELLAMVADALNRDRAKFIAPPSGKTMEPPKGSISFDVEKLHDPLGGQLFLHMLKSGGVVVPPELELLFKAAGLVAAAAGNVGGKNPDGSPTGRAPHGGMADKAERLNKHQDDRTGGVQGVVQ